MYPADTKEMQYQVKKKSMYWYVLSTYQYIWNPHTWKIRGIYLVYPRVMTMYVVTLRYTRYIPVI